VANDRLCCWVRLGECHRSTGKTRHYRRGEECLAPTELRITQFSDDPGFYLFHYDATGAELADTYHESIEDAKTQAAFEFDVKPDEWQTGSRLEPEQNQELGEGPGEGQQ